MGRLRDKAGLVESFNIFLRKNFEVAIVLFYISILMMYCETDYFFPNGSDQEKCISRILINDLLMIYYIKWRQN